MAARIAHPNTILHLVPENKKSEAVLDHPHNRPYVSQSKCGDLGLEIGYHVAIKPCAEKLVEIGRNADLILPGNTISTLQFSFEVHPGSRSIMFYDRSRHYTTRISPDEFRRDGMFRQVVLQHGVTYTIEVGTANKDVYQFRVDWLGEEEAMLAEIDRGYREALLRPPNPCWARTVDDIMTELPTWYGTRLHTPNGGGIERFRILGKLGKGSYGVVKQATDLDSGCLVAAKKLKPSTNLPEDYIRREVKAISGLSHKNIVEYFGSHGWGTPTIYIFTALKDGNVTTLFDTTPDLRHNMPVFDSLLRQMLEALDYLAFRSLIHRDVKPDNILYTHNHDSYLFQLADFGLARKTFDAKTHCGSPKYMAPEMFLGGPQTPKMDVWSLLVSVLDLMQPPGREATLRNRWEVSSFVKKGLIKYPELTLMAHEDPNARASAADVLLKLYSGKGLTTPRSQIRADSRSKRSDKIGSHELDIAAVPIPLIAAEPVGGRVTNARHEQAQARFEYNAALMYGPYTEEPTEMPGGFPSLNF